MKIQNRISKNYRKITKGVKDTKSEYQEESKREEQEKYLK